MGIILYYSSFNPTPEVGLYADATYAFAISYAVGTSIIPQSDSNLGKLIQGFQTYSQQETLLYFDVVKVHNPTSGVGLRKLGFGFGVGDGGDGGDLIVGMVKAH